MRHTALRGFLLITLAVLLTAADGRPYTVEIERPKETLPQYLMVLVVWPNLPAPKEVHEAMQQILDDLWRGVPDLSREAEIYIYDDAAKVPVPGPKYGLASNRAYLWMNGQYAMDATVGRGQNGRILTLQIVQIENGVRVRKVWVPGDPRLY